MLVCRRSGNKVSCNLWDRFFWGRLKTLQVLGDYVLFYFSGKGVTH